VISENNSWDVCLLEILYSNIGFNFVRVCFLSYTKKVINRMKIYRQGNGSAKEGERGREKEREQDKI
jgi:hypothetical protein